VNENGEVANDYLQAFVYEMPTENIIIGII
jgi:hypothetical protein